VTRDYASASDNGGESRGKARDIFRKAGGEERRLARHVSRCTRHVYRVYRKILLAYAGKRHRRGDDERLDGDPRSGSPDGGKRRKFDAPCEFAVDGKRTSRRIRRG